MENQYIYQSNILSSIISKSLAWHSFFSILHVLVLDTRRKVTSTGSKDTDENKMTPPRQHVSK